VIDARLRFRQRPRQVQSNNKNPAEAGS